jgi:GNAT superfamily N-acetyltransferase
MLETANQHSHLLEPGTMTEPLEFEWVLRPDSHPGIEHYVLHFRGEARAWDDEAGDETLVGRIAGHRVDLALARHDNFSLDELLESISHGVAEFKNAAFADSNCYVPLPHAKSSAAQRHCECLVYVDEVVVTPGHRGQGIGTTLFQRMSESIDLENCVIGLKAFPIAEPPGAIRSAEEIDRVKQFYAQLGFHPVGEDYMIKDASLCDTRLKRTALREKEITNG